ncbi:MAG: Ig-like domain-containing protein [Candidatus Shapirobacteria bacterium]
MKRKKLTSLMVLLLMFLFTSTRIALASAFNLQSIGNLNTQGQLYSQWWYTGLQPAFTGEAPASSIVNINIDENSYQATADASGNWSFIPPTFLSAGDHAVSLTNDASTISFTLTLGSENINTSAISSASGTNLPTVGFIWPAIFLLLTGFPLIIFSSKLNKA